MRILYFSLFVVFADQITKFFIKGLHIPLLGIHLSGIDCGSNINIIDNFLQLTLIENPGMAFGIEIGGKPARTVFTLIASLFIIYLIYKNRKESLYFRFSMAFILGGAVGNLINRIFNGIIYGYAPLFYGNVIDFFHFSGPEFKIFGKTFYSWPIFNIADISVTIGFIMIIFGYKKIFLNRENEIQIYNDKPENDSKNTISMDSNYSKFIQFIKN